MEKDNEVKGNGNSYDFGARMHDPRVGRFLSIDSYYAKEPGISPYTFAGNMPISAIDINGDSIFIVAGNDLVYLTYDLMLQIPDGKKIAQKYANNQNEHIIITISDLSGSKNYKNAGGVTMYDGINQFSTLTYKFPINKAMQLYEEGRIFEELSGLDFSRFKGDKIHLIGLSKDLFDRDMSEIPNWKLKGLIEVMYHEIKAHIELDDPVGGGDAEHKKYGSGSHGSYFLGNNSRRDYKPHTPGDEVIDAINALNLPSKSERKETNIDHSKVNDVQNPKQKP